MGPILPDGIGEVHAITTALGKARREPATPAVTAGAPAVRNDVGPVQENGARSGVLTTSSFESLSSPVPSWSIPISEIRKNG
jgi:hypothetical protein